MQESEEEKILRKVEALKEAVEKRQYKQAHELAWRVTAELAKLRRESMSARFRRFLRKIWMR